MQNGQEPLLLTVGLGLAPAFLEDVVVIGPEQLAAPQQLVYELREIEVRSAAVLFQGVIKVASVDEYGYSGPEVVSGDVAVYVALLAPRRDNTVCEAMLREYTPTVRQPTSGVKLCPDLPSFLRRQEPRHTHTPPTPITPRRPRNPPRPLNNQTHA